jgi:phosphoesterase RecJ-like protein
VQPNGGKSNPTSNLTTVCFDHHPCDNGGPADINVMDSSATATGRLAWDYINHVDGRIDREIAESVFVSICTDTGWFRYPNTTAGVLDLAAHLTRYQLDLPAIYRAIYQSQSAPMLRLLGHATRTMREENGGRFVWSFIRREFMDDLGVGRRFDSDPIIDVLRSGREVEAVALFSEQSDGSVAVSLRSRGDPDMNAIARKFGGGGHVHAAGTTLPAKTAEHDVESLVAVIRRATRPE